MKKLFLLSLSCVFSMVGFAQITNVKTMEKTTPVSSVQKMLPAQKFSPVNLASPVLSADKKLLVNGFATSSRRSAADGVFYRRPSGTYYCGWTRDWLSFSTNVLFCLPLGENEFVNACENPAEALWSLETSSGSYPLTGDEETNNYTWTGMSYNPSTDTYDNGFNMFYTPTITVGDVQYTLGDENGDDGAVLSAAGRVSPFAKAPITACYSGWSDGGTIYGSEANIDFDFDDDEVTEHYNIAGIWEIHEKPISPMYVENVVVLGRLNSDDSEAVIDDATPLKITICDIEEDENGREWPGNNVIAELTCTQSDVEPVTSSGKVIGFSYVFANKETDIFGTETSVPFVLDQKYCIVLSWVGQNNKVNIGANVFTRKDDDIYARVPAYMILEDENGEYATTTLSYSGVTVTPIFEAMYDYVEVYDELTNTSTGEKISGLSILTAPVEGGNIWEQTDPSINTFAYTETFLSWEDAEENENYFIDDMPDWITDYVIEEDREGDEASGFTFVSFTVEPLPAGMNSRSATVHISGKGFMSKPITIVQGNGESGINTIKSDIRNAKAAIFNVAGQRVNNNYKGLVVKDGCKFMNK